MTILDDILDYKILGNTGSEIIAAIVAFLVTFVVLVIIKRVFIVRLSRSLEKREDQRKITDLLASLRKILSFGFIIFISLFVASFQLYIDDSIRKYINFFVYAYMGYVSVKFAFAFVDFVVSSKKLQESIDAKNLLNLFRMVIKSIIVVMIFLAILPILGVNVNAFIAGLGVFGLAIAFALQNVIADLFASIIIYIDNPFEIGDSITVGNDSGTVESIGIRSTKIRATNGHTLVIPNRDLSNSRINNFKRMTTRRVVTTLGVHCDTPVEKLKALPDQIKAIIESKPDVVFDRVHFTNMGASSYDFEIVYKITTRDLVTSLDRKQEINLELLGLLENQGISIPYPTQTIRMEK